MSVAIPTYNSALYLREQLESIRLQTRPPDEVVVSDNCSTDPTVEMVRGFAATAPFSVRISVNERNLGISLNVDRAITECTGDIVVLADSDDVCFPRRFEEIEAAFVDFPEAVMVQSDLELVDEQLRQLGRTFFQTFGLKVDRTTLMDQRPLWKMLRLPWSGAAMAFRSTLRDLLLPIPGPSIDKTRRLLDSWHEKWIVFLGALTGDVVILPEPLVKYRLHPRQMSGNMEYITRWTRFSDFFRRLQSFDRNEPPSQFGRLLFDRVARSLPPDGRRFAELASWASHCSVRADLPPRLAPRLLAVVREALTLRYYRYSGGFLGAAKDLAFPR